MDPVERECGGEVGAAVGAVAQLGVANHAGEHHRHRDVEDGDDPKRGQNPRGTSRCGLRVSSAVVATMSKPMKAKNTIEAPARTPYQP